MRRLIVISALAGALLVPATAEAETWHRCGWAPNGLGIQANENTSCRFARMVGLAADKSAFDRVLWVWSPVTHRIYRMRRYGCGCSSIPFRPFVYRGGRGAAVRFVS